MSGERAPREVEASPLALHLALWIPFAILVVLSWFTVLAPELATERPHARGRRDGGAEEAAAPSPRPTDQPGR